MTSGTEEASPRYDYVSPGLTLVHPDEAFPHLRTADPIHHPWKYLRRDVPHKWYADERYPEMGVLNRDEATLLHNVALQFSGRHALEIGGWLGWSTVHLALAGVSVDVVDPAHDDDAFRASVSTSIAACGVDERVHLAGGRSPETVIDLGTTQQRRWSLVFIDGDHDSPAPVRDVEACLPFVTHDCAFVFHDVASPDVAEGLRVLANEGFQIRVYQTAQIMAVAWRGNVVAPEHVPDPEVAWQVPTHLLDLPIVGINGCTGGVACPDLRDALTENGESARPRVCVVSNEIIGFFKNGGIGTAMSGLVESLARDDLDVTLLYTGNLWRPHVSLEPWKSRYAEMGVKLVAIPFEDMFPIQGPVRDCGYVLPFLVYRYLSTEHFDVVHFNDCCADGALSLVARKLGLAFEDSLFVTTLHSPSQWAWELNQLLPSSLLHSAFNYSERLSIHCTDVLLCPSRYLLAWAHERGFVIPDQRFAQQYVIPSTQFGAPGVASQLPEPAYGRASPPRTIVFFGRLEERKGLRLFCNALQRIGHELAAQDISVTFLGKSGQCAGMDALEYINLRAADWAFRVEILDDLDQPEAIEYLRTGDKLAVMPSGADNSPCTVYEAISYGIPFLAAATGGIPELVADADREHVLFVYNTASLEHALRTAVAEGGWVARPAITQADIRRNVLEFHAQWRSFRPPAPPDGLVRGVVAVIDHDRGADLQATLDSLAACDSVVRRVIILDRSGEQTQVGAAATGATTIDVVRQDVNELHNELATLGDEHVLLLHSGVTVIRAAFLSMVRALELGVADGLLPVAQLHGEDGETKFLVPMGGSRTFSLYQGVTFTGGMLARGPVVAAAVRTHELMPESAFMGIADLCVAQSETIWPYPDVVLDHSQAVTIALEGGLPGRVAAYTEASATDRYFMLAIGYSAVTGYSLPSNHLRQAVLSLVDAGLSPAIRLASSSVRRSRGVAGRVRHRVTRVGARVRSRQSERRSPAAPSPVPASVEPKPRRHAAGPAGLTRVGPVHFQPLEQELGPVSQYLTGRLLDAGCGTRDISGFLMAQGVTEVVRCDIACSEPGGVTCALESIPLADASFDSVLCNAVLEHVADAEQVMRELARVIRPGGHVVVAVPFLQPYHAAPDDYRRYTVEGLTALGVAAGLEVVEVLPVHSFAQTMGWMLWEHALEKGGQVRRIGAWTTAYLATRRWNRTDPDLRKVANTFQAVFTRGGVARHRVSIDDWRRKALPASAENVVTMLVPDEIRLLNFLADDYFIGSGAIVDAGSFLGGSTVALADGLRRNLARRGLSEQKLIHSYDRFEVEEWTRRRYFPRSAAGESFYPQFAANVAPFRNLIEVHVGSVEDHPWTGGPIEILFIDLAKHWTTCDWVSSQFFAHLSPGSIVVQQDYLYHECVAWLHITMEFYSEYFEYVCDTKVNSVVFRCVQAIPPDALREHTVASLTRDEKITLMDRAASRFQGAQRDMLRSAKRDFLQMLDNA